MKVADYPADPAGVLAVRWSILAACGQPTPLVGTMANYTVQQGDFVSKLAKQFGLDYKTIWNHPSNAALKKQRKNPNVLLPGDILFIPERQLREESRSTDQLHEFQVPVANLKLRLTLEDQFRKPIANAKCVLVLEADSRTLTTDEKGHFEESLSPDVHNVLLVVQDDQTPLKDLKIPIKIGNLDPVDELPGQIERLNNLGYFAGRIDNADENDPAFRSAVEEFQCDFHLTVDGVCGPKTQAKLLAVHGC